MAIAGAHGKIGRLLTIKLIADGHSVVGLVRNLSHLPECESLGATAVLADLEIGSVADIAAVISGCDAAVFAAGAGPGSSAERKLTVDRDGAIKLLGAAAAASVERFVIISSVGTENPPADDAVFSVYLRAKAAADDAVRASHQRWTIIRPGALTDDPGTGNARVDVTPFRGSVSRDDVAGVVAAVLADPRADGRTLYVNGGDEPIAGALTAALQPGA